MVVIRQNSDYLHAYSDPAISSCQLLFLCIFSKIIKKKTLLCISVKGGGVIKLPQIERDILYYIFTFFYFFFFLFIFNIYTKCFKFVEKITEEFVFGVARKHVDGYHAVQKALNLESIPNWLYITGRLSHINEQFWTFLPFLKAVMYWSYLSYISCHSLVF